MSKSAASKAKPRLGRGLSSLISVSELPVEVEIPAKEGRRPDGDSATQTPTQIEATGDVAGQTFRILESNPTTPVLSSGQPQEIPVDSIAPNPHQPRRSMSEEKLAELAASLRSTGLIQPIIVRATEQGFQLIAGERRLRAAKLAGLSTVPAYVRDVDGFTQAQMALVENIQREDLNAIDRAQAYRALVDQLGLTQSELATRLGEERSSIANFLRLLDLAEPVKTLIREGQLSLGHAKLIAGVADVLEQQRLADLVVSQELSVRNLERLLQQGHTQAEPAPRSTPSAHLQDLERSLTRQLGMRVQVRTTSKKGRGRLVVHYASLDQFDELLAKLGLKAD